MDLFRFWLLLHHLQVIEIEKQLMFAGKVFIQASHGNSRILRNPIHAGLAVMIPVCRKFLQRPVADPLLLIFRQSEKCIVRHNRYPPFGFII